MEWVSTKDKLPDENQFILAYRSEIDICPMSVQRGWTLKKSHYWMPLPEPPKGE